MNKAGQSDILLALNLPLVQTRGLASSKILKSKVSTMKRSYFLLVPLAALMLSFHVSAQDVADKSLNALLKDYAANKEGRIKKYKTFKPRFEAFAKAHEGSEDGLKAHLWLFKNSWWLRQENKMESTAVAIVDHIINTYPKSKLLDEIAAAKYVLPKDRRLNYFRSIRKVSPHDSVRAAMLLGESYSQKGDAKRSTLEELKKKFAKVSWNASTYGAIASALLNPNDRAKLKIGKTAPDIEGSDVDGTTFKLSDYRGKVVLLDFWGNW